eukprot:PhF_6_TR14258/c0_g1_i3/m.22918
MSDVLPHCFVAKSFLPGDSGFGVFASNTIEIGTIVTKYSGRLISLNEYLTLVVSNDPRVHYVMAISDTEQIIPNDIQSHDPMACGHVVNDRLCVLNPETFVEDSHTYVKEKGIRNARFDRATLSIIATTTILQNEEIYIEYGYPYWASRCYQNLFWSEQGLGNVEVREKARYLRDTVAAKLVEDLKSLPPLPVEVQVNTQDPSNILLTNKHSGMELSDAEVFMAGMLYFNRDPMLLKLKPNHIRKLLVAMA